MKYDIEYIYIYIIFFQESYDHRRYLSLISGVYPGYFVFLGLLSLDPQALRSKPSAVSKIGTRNEGSRLVSDEGMVKCDDFSPNQLMMKKRHFWNVMFILYIVSWFVTMWFSCCFCSFVSFKYIFCIFLTHLKYVFEPFGPPWGVTYLQNIRKPGPKAPPEGESPSMDMSQNDVCFVVKIF